MKTKMFPLAMMALFLVAPLKVFAQEQAPAPVYQDGDFWRFRAARKVYEASIKDGKLQIYEPKPDQKVDADPDTAAQLKTMLAVEQEEKQFLQFPLSVGKSWSSSYQAEQRGTGRLINVPGHSSATGIEEITTPAGTFRAFKIERVETEPPTSLGGRRPHIGARRTYTYYYSPQTRSIVKYNCEESFCGKINEIELIKYGTAR